VARCVCYLTYLEFKTCWGIEILTLACYLFKPWEDLSLRLLTFLLIIFIEKQGEFLVYFVRNTHLVFVCSLSHSHAQWLCLAWELGTISFLISFLPENQNKISHLKNNGTSLQKCKSTIILGNRNSYHWPFHVCFALTFISKILKWVEKFKTSPQLLPILG
jgi:hypothetical protein